MPTYDYQCGGCQHEFEHFQSISSSVLRKCPECGALKLKRLIGAGAAVVFKGSGFYQTDYRSESYKKRASQDSSSGSSGSESKSETGTKSDQGAKSDKSAKSEGSDSSSSSKKDSTGGK
jgi:putative FmdB family regulatory protein